MRPVAGIAENREKEAAKLFGESQQAVSEQQQHLEELLSYREEYRQKLEQKTSSGMSVMMMQDFRRFMNQLNSAIEHQRNQIALYQQSCDTRKLEWLAKRTHSQAIEKAVGRFQDQERRQQSRREQSESDEFAQNLFSRPRGGEK